MTAQFTPLEQVEWREVGIIQTSHTKGFPEYRWNFQLPRPLADWGVFDYWERDRLNSMGEHLTPGMTLFDVGAEHGWMSLLYASMVGPENMVLIEPTQDFWPNIKATWERNYAVEPKGCFDVLVSDKTTKQGPWWCGWPGYSDGPLIDRNSYRNIFDNVIVPEITLDDLVERSGIIPDALTIDVEGAEHLVVAGAARTLVEHHPLLWVSIHPDLMLKHYGTLDTDLHDFMAEIGYTGHLLAVDHESHYLFTP